jgi:hypothetical protein
VRTALALLLTVVLSPAWAQAPAPAKPKPAAPKAQKAKAPKARAPAQAHAKPTPAQIREFNALQKKQGAKP